MKTFDVSEPKFLHRHEAKKSIFLGFGVNFCKNFSDHFDAALQTLHQDHRRATHVVYAIRTPEFSKIFDAHEPKNSATQILNALQNSDFFGAIAVVRYFGGTKLGLGNLMRAYGACAKGVIDSAISHGAVKIFAPESHEFMDFSLSEFSFWQSQIFAHGLSADPKTAQKTADFSKISLKISGAAENIEQFLKFHKEKNGLF